MKKRNYLTDEQKEYIIKNYPFMQTRIIAENLGVSKKQVEGYAWSKGIKKDKNFKVIRIDNSLSFEQIDYIIDNFSLLTNKEIAEKLNITTDKVAGVGRRFGLKKKEKFLKENTDLTVEQRKFILENYATMLTIEISQKIGVSCDRIRAYAYRHGVRRNRDKVPIMIENSDGLTISQKKFIIENYSSMKNEDIAEVLGIEPIKVHNYASNRKLTKDFEAKKKRDNYFKECLEKRNDSNYNYTQFLGHDLEPKLLQEELYISKYGKYHVNQNYFEKIDNEWKAYWLGFLYADGCVHIDKGKKKKEMIALGLKASDIGHIQRFLDSIQSEAPIRIYNTNYGSSKAAKVSVCNKKLVQDLIKLGCVERKSLILTFPSFDIVPKEFVRHFIRGYFDGDGCIHINIERENARLSFNGTEKFLLRLREILIEELSIPKTEVRRTNSRAFEWTTGNKYTIFKIFNYLYKDANIFLERKFKIFDAVYCLE